MTQAPSERREQGRPRWQKRALLGLGLAVFVIVAAFLGAAFLPRWWAHRIGAQAGGNFTAGIALGLFYGFVFTAVPLAVLRVAFRKRRALKRWALMLGAALVLALPNLLTLGIVLGSGGAAHAGERTLDVDAPGFRNASLAGALVALAAFLVAEYLLVSRRRARHRLESLRGDLDPRDDAPSSSDERR